ncbi:MAG: sulfite exporter TauE/SafE family protein [Deltaproteobacteria bacterium]|nr:sulfite exporter TauE/SafE family protein [Deltaproteobacteria bacterium]
MQELGVAGIVFLAAFTQGVVGFGFGLVAMGLLPLLVPELVAIPLVAIYSLCVAAFIAWQVRAHVSWTRLRPLLVGLVVGVPLGIAFLTTVDPRWIRLTLGVFLVAYVMWSLTFAARLGGRHVSDRWGYLAGLLSGVLGGAFNTGGPPLAVYVTMKDWSKDATKATLQVLFALTSVLAIVGHATTGRMTPDVLRLTAIVLPAVVAGVWVGARLYARIDQRTFQRGLLAVLFIVGLVFMNKALHVL